MQTVTVPMEALAQLIILQLEKNKTADLNVTGSSMKPMLEHRRDSVTLLPVENRCKPGDIILYCRENEKYVLHRILRLVEGGYICCGDNQAEEETVMDGQLIAVVSGFTRKGKSYTLDHAGYRLYVWVWLKLFWLRPTYIKVRRRIGRFLGRQRKKKYMKELKRNRRIKHE